tara:strand:- start:799 stop:1407 length:609 start_codon:yes stop_codon:yes gene_type:complete
MSYLDNKKQHKLIKHIKKWTNDPCTDYLISGIDSYGEATYVYTDKSIFKFSNNDDKNYGGVLRLVEGKYRFDEGLSPESKKRHNVEQHYNDMSALKPDIPGLVAPLCNCLKTKMSYSWISEVNITDEYIKKHSVLTLNFSLADNLMNPEPTSSGEIRVNYNYDEVKRPLNTYTDEFDGKFKTLISPQDINKFKSLFPNKVEE